MKKNPRNTAVDVAIVGGAFDPPHLGHLSMALLSLSLGFARQVWFMPSPHRWDKSPGTSFATRTSHLQALLHLCPQKWRRQIEISDFEIGLGEFGGSLALMKALERAYPETSFGFVMGHDTLVKTQTWTNRDQTMRTGKIFLKTIPCLIFDRVHTQRKDGLELVKNTVIVEKMTLPVHEKTRIEADLAASASRHLSCLPGFSSPRTPGHPELSEISSTAVRNMLLQQPPPPLKVLEGWVGRPLAELLLSSSGALRT